MNDINRIMPKIKEFRDQRDWSQFHNPKDLALAISIEANKVLELFLWKNPEEADKSIIISPTLQQYNFTEYQNPPTTLHIAD